MTMLRVYGNFQQIDELNRIQLGYPDAWDAHRIGDQVREGLHVLVDDGEYEAEGILEFDGEYWVARLVPDTGKKSTRETETNPQS